MQQAYTSDGVEAFADTLMVNSEPMMATIDRPSGGVFPVNIGLTLQGSPDVLTKKNKWNWFPSQISAHALYPQPKKRFSSIFPAQKPKIFGFGKPTDFLE